MSDKKEIRSQVRAIQLHKKIPAGSVAQIAKKTSRPDQTVRAVLYGTWFDAEILQEACNTVKTAYAQVKTLEEMLDGFPITTDPALLAS